MAIRELIYRYAMAIDNLDASMFADCFAKKAVLWGENRNVPGASFNLQGEDIAKAVEWHREYAFTMHNVQNHLYTIHGDAAQGLAYCVVSTVRNKAGTWMKTDQYIHYRDALVKQGERWRFLNRQFQLFFTTEVPVENFIPGRK